MSSKHLTLIDGKGIYYVPYLIRVEMIKKGLWCLHYNGGKTSVNLKKALTIHFLGVNAKTGSLPLLFIQDSALCGVSIIISRTHQSFPAIISGVGKSDRHDLLTKQILCRENMKRKAYISRILVRRCFEGRECISSYPDSLSKKLGLARSNVAVMKLEAIASKEYWGRYYLKLGLKGLSRRGSSNVSAALNALSKYQSGIILRWIVQHGFSPSHGYLHRSTRYDSLLYDFMEPYRCYIEKSVFNCLKETPELIENKDLLIKKATIIYKEMLNEKVLASPTYQIVYRKTLLQGIVIAFRHFLEGKMQRFLPPIEVEKSVGRPFKVSYRLPGEIK